jgi:hypothetical protein
VISRGADSRIGLAQQRDPAVAEHLDNGMRVISGAVVYDDNFKGPETLVDRGF